ncbi:putative transcription factor GRF family [Helianthus anomalus]
MVMCRCGKQAGIKTSWTDINPGHQFYTCVQLVSFSVQILCVDRPSHVSSVSSSHPRFDGYESST